MTRLPMVRLYQRPARRSNSSPAPCAQVSGGPSTEVILLREGDAESESKRVIIGGAFNSRFRSRLAVPLCSSASDSNVLRHAFPIARRRLSGNSPQPTDSAQWLSGLDFAGNEARSRERQTVPSGASLAGGRNRRIAGRREPAESRLQPGLAAPQSRPESANVFALTQRMRRYKMSDDI